MYFYPRSPCGERLYTDLDSSYGALISIHALLAESDRGGHINKARSQHFYPRSPCGERHARARSGQQRSRFLSTLSLRRATRQLVTVCSVIRFLSTLSLRRATCAGDSHFRLYNVFLSTLSLRRATCKSKSVQRRDEFLSTLSLRRATVLGAAITAATKFLSTLSLRRATW